MWFKRRENLGTVLLAVWLIATGALPLVGYGNATVSLVLSVLAIAAGAFLLWSRR
jgi:hypothetical protein